MQKNFKILSFYKFINLIDLDNKKFQIKKNLIDLKLKGTVVISEEGINGTISGLANSVKSFEVFISQLLCFNDFDVKNYSHSNTDPFVKPKVKLKKEVVPIEKKTWERKGKYIKPQLWNNFISDPNVLTIDIRKPFEYEMGTFVGALDPNVKNFREFKIFFDNLIKSNIKKKLAIFCTGGVRCEKASDYLFNKGFKNVFQLEGGILNYLSNTGIDKSKWKGECFVFDKRVSVNSSMEKGTYEVCFGCRMPVNLQGKKSHKYEYGVSCNKCHDFLTTNQKKRFKMREINLREKNHENRS